MTSKRAHGGTGVVVLVGNPAQRSRTSVVAKLVADHLAEALGGAAVEVVEPAEPVPDATTSKDEWLRRARS